MTSRPAGATVSVVIPTYNRPEPLGRCLEALAALDYPRAAYEVVVVDDGSPTPVFQTAQRFSDRLDLTVIRQAQQGPSAARNAGAKAAKHCLLAFTDDDCLAAPGWLRAFERAAIDYPGALIGGRVVNVLEDNPYAGASQAIVDFLYDYYRAAEGEAPFFTSNNLAVPRDRFLELGGFDVTFPLAAAEDREFGLRWRRRFGALRYAPEALIGHAHPLTLRRFCRQHANYGRGARHLSRVNAAAGVDQHRVEPPGFYWGLVTYPRTAPKAPVLKCALVALSQAAMTWGYLTERLARG